MSNSCFALANRGIIRKLCEFAIVQMLPSIGYESDIAGDYLHLQYRSYREPGYSGVGGRFDAAGEAAGDLLSSL